MGWTFYNSSGQQLRNTGTVLATQAEMEAGSSIAAFVTPGRTQYHPGVAKARCSFAANGTIVSGSHNVASTAKTATGAYSITISPTAFADVLYQVALTPWNTTTAAHVTRVDDANRAVGVVKVNVFDGDDAAGDEGLDFIAFGDQ